MKGMKGTTTEDEEGTRRKKVMVQEGRGRKGEELRTKKRHAGVKVAMIREGNKRKNG